MKPLFAILTAAMITLSGSAQLPGGSIAPDFTATDIDGVEHNLHSYLDSGYQVILDFTATWCGPCWSYHEAGTLQDLYETYGPDGTNEIRIFMLESDENTTDADLNGTGGNTQGDWVTGTQYPIIDNASNIFDSYSNTYYPTIYTVCPSRILSESGQISVAGHTEVFQSNACAAASLPNDAALVGYTGETMACGDSPITLSVELLNLGLDNLTSCTITAYDGANAVGSTDWSGSLETYAIEDVVVTTTALDGSTDFDFTITSSDDNADNNSATSGMVNVSAQTTNNIRFTLLTDAYPGEISWGVYDENGNAVEEVNGYADQGAEFIYDMNLPFGCYVFRIADAFGDGLHASWYNGTGPDGSFSLDAMDGTSVNQNLITYASPDEYALIEFPFEVTSLSSVNGCTDLEACNYWEGASEDDGSCEYESCAGCMEEGACNFNPGASIADESCDYSCFGCLDPGAWNYAPEATIDDGSCLFFVPTCEFEGSESWLGLETGLFAGLDTLTFEFGVLDSGSLVINLPMVMEEPGTGSLFAVLGWNDLSWAGLPQGMEWSSSLASLEAGHHQCIGLEGTPYEEGLFDLTVSGDLVLQVFGQPYPLGMFAATLPLRVIPNEQGVWGCTYANATNFLAFANVDDGSCSYDGCMDLDANNYQLFATVDDGSCIFDSLDPACPGDVDGDGTVGTGDLLALLSSFGLICQ